MDFSKFDERPIVVAIAGPNGAGKTTFFYAHLASAGLRFVNADTLSKELELKPYDAARLADSLRRELIKNGESFAFETVFSDPVGDNVAFLKQAVNENYNVVLCYIGISDVDQSIQRVAMRVTQGGHDVPDNKLKARFARTLDNLKIAIQCLPHVLVFDNSNLNAPYRRVAVFESGHLCEWQDPIPEWLIPLLPH